MNSGALRILGVLAIAAAIPACNLTFTSGDPSAIPAPQDPYVLQVPYHGQAGVWPTNTQFAWGAYPGAASYELELSRKSDFSEILHVQSNIPFASVFLPVSLTHATTYYWRVSTLVGAVRVFAGGGPFQFTTVIPVFGPPVPFFLQSPLGTTAGRTPAFTWTYAQEAVSYSLQIDEAGDFLAPVADLQDLRLTRAVCPILLDANKTYFWQVTAANSGGTRTSSPVTSTFFTGP